MHHSPEGEINKWEKVYLHLVSGQSFGSVEMSFKSIHKNFWWKVIESAICLIGPTEKPKIKVS